MYVHVFDVQIHELGCCKKVQRGDLPVLMGPLSWHMQRKKDTKGHRVFAYIINMRLREDIIKKKPFYKHKTMLHENAVTFSLRSKTEMYPGLKTTAFIP